MQAHTIYQLFFRLLQVQLIKMNLRNQRWLLDEDEHNISKESFKRVLEWFAVVHTSSKSNPPLTWTSPEVRHFISSSLLILYIDCRTL
jgi:hypothetical protein